MTEGETPEFGGTCALGVGLGLGSKAPEGKAKYAVEKGGKTYYLSGPLPKLIFEHVPGMVARAEKKAAA
jgi:YHS domain-containing protein